MEAMAAGCIPVVISKGGQKEIINDRHNGFLFDSWEELKNITLNIIRREVNIKQIRKNAVKNCRRFSNLNFKENLGSKSKRSLALEIFAKERMISPSLHLYA